MPLEMILEGVAVLARGQLSRAGAESRQEMTGCEMPTSLQTIHDQDPSARHKRTRNKEGRTHSQSIRSAPPPEDTHLRHRLIKSPHIFHLLF